MAHTTDTTSTNYVVREEYREAWGSPQPGTSVDMGDIRRLAETWDVTVESLMDQVAPARYYRADDDGAQEDYEAACMDDAIAIARESWESATEGVYEVTVEEYESEDAREEGRNPVASETITVEAK